MSIATIGGIPFRINPSQVSWEYSVDTAVIPTVGGRVVQILGATMGDMTIRGLYGQERSGSRRESWQLAEEFQKGIAGLMDRQSVRPTRAQLNGTDPTPMHPTVRFVYNDTVEARAAGLPPHDWDFNVYVKALEDVGGGGMTVQHSTGKFSYGYTLTLFIQQDNTGKLATIAKDEFIERLSKGLGWQRTPYNGHFSTEELQKYLATNSPDDPTIHGLVLKQFTTASAGQIPQAGSATNPVPGGISVN